ncbi:MAG: hypothetical protein Q9163_004120 [Psora crenata]
MEKDVTNAHQMALESAIFGRLGQHASIGYLDRAQDFLSNSGRIHEVSQELSYSVTLLKIDLEMRRHDHTRAMEILEELAERVEDDEADIYIRTKVMVVKARIYSGAGIPQKGFSVAVRAANIALDAHILPVLWEAICAICAILHSTGEFEGSLKLLEVILPRVLECEDCDLAGYAYSLLADTHVGIAGSAEEESLQRKEQLLRALFYLDKAFLEFSKIGDRKNLDEMLAKRATVLRLNGDRHIAEGIEARYIRDHNARRRKKNRGITLYDGYRA